MLFLLAGCSGTSLYIDGEPATKEEVEAFAAKIQTTDGFVPDGYYSFEADRTVNSIKTTTALQFAVEYSEGSPNKRFISRLSGVEVQYDAEGEWVYNRVYNREGTRFKESTSSADGTSSSKGSDDVELILSGPLFNCSEAALSSYNFVLDGSSMHAYHESEEGSSILVENHVGVRYSSDFGRIENAEFSYHTKMDGYESIWEGEYRSSLPFNAKDIDWSYDTEILTDTYTI